jgi:hypothetical protein
MRKGMWELSELSKSILRRECGRVEAKFIHGEMIRALIHGNKPLNKGTLKTLF